MKKRRIVSICLLLILAFNMIFVGTSVMAEENAKSNVTFYVAPNGNDSNVGTIDSPLATMAGARDKVREYKTASGLPDGGITVYFRGGTYNITQTTYFESQDSGTAQSPITYTAYPNETPAFSGGIYLNGSDFKNVTDTSALERFSNEAKGKILCYDLKSNGITDYGVLLDSTGWSWTSYRDQGINDVGFVRSPMEVYVDDEYQTIARWPNKLDNGTSAFVYTGKPLAYGRKGTSPKEELPEFTYLDERIEGWKTYDDVYVLGCLKADYADDNIKILSVNKEKNTMKLKAQASHGVLENKKYYYYNVMEELDAPGEYFIDRTNGMLYIYPTKDLTSSTIKLSMLDTAFMIKTKDTSFVTFSGLTFELTRGSVFKIEGGDNCSIAYCTIKNIGVQAVYLGTASAGSAGVQASTSSSYNNLTNGINHSVTGCEMKNLGFGGVELNGGNLYTLERANYSVTNTKISKFSLRKKSYVPAIGPNGFGFYIAYNDLSDSTHAAICGGAQGLVIEYNNLYDLVKETEDAGAMYLNYTMPINDVYIRNNYIHDVPNSSFGLGSESGVVMRPAIYLDSDFFMPTIEGNVIANVPIGFGGAAKGEIIRNNIFIDCLRATTKGSDTNYLNGHTGKDMWEVSGHSAFNSFPTKYPYKSEPWVSAYPEFTKYMETLENSDNAAYWNGIHENNLIVFNKQQSFYEKNLPENTITSMGDSYIYKDNIITNQDPGFVDMANQNYQLKKDANVFTQNPNFKYIDMSKIGIQIEKVGAQGVNSNNLNYSQLGNILNKLNKAIALELDTPNALVNGEFKNIDSKNPEVMPAVINDRTLVPVRFISENLGAKVGWDDKTQKVSINIDGKEIALVIGDKSIYVDGKAIQMDVASQTINDRTMIPLRSLVESLGKNVFWDDRGLIVISNDSSLLNIDTDRDIITEVINFLKLR